MRGDSHQNHDYHQCNLLYLIVCFHLIVTVTMRYWPVHVSVQKASSRHKIKKKLVFRESYLII